MAVAEIEIQINANPTQALFAASEKLENALFAPRGEGKTEAGIIAMCDHALRQPESARPIVWCLIRDTWANIERTTLRDFKRSQVAPGLEFRKGGREIILPGFWHCYLFGVDSLGDLERLRATWGGVWIEEPAPAAVEDIGGGVAEEALEIALTGLRGAGGQPRAQITANYPDEDHWTWKRYKLNPADTVACFEIPRGENRHLDRIAPGYREMMATALRNRPDLARRLVQGLPGFVAQGEAVTPEWMEKDHMAPHRLEVLRGIQLKMAWDFGLTPAAIFSQVSPLGQLRIYDVIVGLNVGIRQLIEGPVMPLLYGKYRGLDIAHYGGEEGLIREQSDSEQTAVATLTQLIPGPYTPGPVAWPARRDALRSLHNMKLGAEGPAVLMDPVGALPLIRACRGGWHYKKLPTGEVIRDVPVKDKHSHPGDAYAALAACIGFGSGVRVQRGLRSIKSPSYSWSEPTIVLGR